MILIFTIFLILFEAIGEGLIKRYSPSVSAILFKGWVQWIIAIGLTVLWFLFALHFNNLHIPAWKLITGFVFVRFLIFDTAWNLTMGVKWNFYGTTKLYDRVMNKLGGGLDVFAKVVLGIVGICFLCGIS